MVVFFLYVGEELPPPAGTGPCTGLPAYGHSGRWQIVTFPLSHETLGEHSWRVFVFVCGATRFYQHTFTEQQEHARARFKRKYIPRFVVTSHPSNSYCSVSL